MGDRVPDGESVGQDVLPYIAMAWASGYSAAKGQAVELVALHVEELHAVLAEHAARRGRAVALRSGAASARDVTLAALAESHAAASRIAAAIGDMVPQHIGQG